MDCSLVNEWRERERERDHINFRENQKKMDCNLVNESFALIIKPNMEITKNQIYIIS